MLVKKLVILIVIVFVLDRAIGYVIEKMFYTEKQGDFSVTTYALTKANEDILIFGTSRASHHYVAAMFKKELGLSAYNLGRDGVIFDYDYALITDVLKRYSPKGIIIDLNSRDLMVDTTMDRKEIFTSIFLPYINKDSYIRSLVAEESPAEVYKARISKLYSFNSLLVPIIQHHIGVGQKNNYGYEAKKGSTLKPTDKPQIINNLNYSEVPLLREEFEKVVAVIEKKHIKLFVIISPEFRVKKYNSSTTANAILHKYGLKVMDFSRSPEFNKPQLFYDNAHMNDIGAKMFTSILLKDSLKMGR